VLIGPAQLEALALGAAVLGTGGGGDPHIGLLLGREAMRAHGPVELVGVESVPDDAHVVCSAMIGAPTIMLEKLPEGGEALRALRAFERFAGRSVTHVLAAEAGGLNSVVPFAVAAQAGLPVVDADLMGRAFPELQMCLPTLSGLGASPMSMADDKGNVTCLATVDNGWAERIARSACIDMGGAALMCLYPLGGRDLREVTVRGTLSLCADLGAAIVRARARHEDPVGTVVERLGGRRLFHGKVVDVDRRTQGGFARASVALQGVGGDAGARMSIRAQNEHLLAVRDDAVVASVPDLIMLLDPDTAEPFTTEGIRYGLRAVVVAAPCDPRWRTPEGLDLVGPRAFGYDVEFAPLGEDVGGEPHRGLEEA